MSLLEYQESWTTCIYTRHVSLNIPQFAHRFLISSVSNSPGGADSLQCRSAAFSCDESHLVCAYCGGTLEVERTDTWNQECKPLFWENGSLNYAVFSPDGSVILAATADMYEQVEMTTWDTTIGSLRVHFPVTDIGYHTPVDDTMWSGILGYMPHCFSGYSSLAMFSHDSQYLVAALNHEAHLWSVTTGRLVR